MFFVNQIFNKFIVCVWTARRYTLKNTQKVDIFEEMDFFYDFVKNRYFRKLTIDFENRTKNRIKRPAETKVCVFLKLAARTFPTEQVPDHGRDWTVSVPDNGRDWTYQFLIMGGIGLTSSWSWEGLDYTSSWSWEGLDCISSWSWEGLDCISSWSWEGLDCISSWSSGLGGWTYHLIIGEIGLSVPDHGRDWTVSIPDVMGGIGLTSSDHGRAWTVSVPDVMGRIELISSWCHGRDWTVSVPGSHCSFTFAWLKTSSPKGNDRSPESNVPRSNLISKNSNSSKL